MKAHSLTIYSIATLMAFNFFSVKNITHSTASRMPSSEKVSKNVPVKKKVVSAKELKAIKAKKAKLESDLLAKAKETKDAKDAKDKQDADKKIEALRTEIAELAAVIKEAKVKDNEELQTSLCLSKRHEAELEEQIKKQLQDKEDILKEFESLKAEVKSSKTSPGNPIPPAQPIVSPAGNSDIVALMAQITSLFQAQLQNQSQMQTQMINMFSQMNYNLTPTSMMSNSMTTGMGGYGIGMNASYSPVMYNPYSATQGIPMERTQIPFSNGFNFGAAPAAPVFGGGFNFGSTLPIANVNSPSLSVAQAK
jgi:hypothetical protein